MLRELRATARRACEQGTAATTRRLLALERVGVRAQGSDAARRRGELERLALALAAHDPERTLARGYALVEDPAGQRVCAASDARSAGEIVVRFHDGTIVARVT